MSDPVVVPGFLLARPRSSEQASLAGRNDRNPVKSNAPITVITRCHAVAEAGRGVLSTVRKTRVLLHGPTITIYSQITNYHASLSLCVTVARGFKLLPVGLYVAYYLTIVITR